MEKKNDAMAAKLDQLVIDQNAKIDSLATGLQEVTEVAKANQEKLDQLIEATNNLKVATSSVVTAEADGPVPAQQDTSKASGPRAHFDQGTIAKELQNQKTPEKEKHQNATTSSGRSSRVKKKQPKKTSSDSDSGTEEEDLNTSGYVYDCIVDGKGTTHRGNYRHRPTSLNIEEFEFGSNTAEWTSWVKKFEGTVKSACDP